MGENAGRLTGPGCPQSNAVLLGTFAARGRSEVMCAYPIALQAHIVAISCTGGGSVRNPLRAKLASRAFLAMMSETGMTL
jgi:hypothetical protein